MASLPIKPYTPDEYLAIEREADFKSEYLSGEMFAMAGASERHDLIAGNLIAEVRTQLKGRPCRTYPSDMKVETGPVGLYSYPDVTVACGQPLFHDDRRDVLLNPTVLFEVLSPSTEAFDRGAKFAHYRRIESLTDYVIVSTSEHRVEHYIKQSGNQWLLTWQSESTPTLSSKTSTAVCHSPKFTIAWILRRPPGRTCQRCSNCGWTTTPHFSPGPRLRQTAASTGL